MTSPRRAHAPRSAQRRRAERRLFVAVVAALLAWALVAGAVSSDGVAAEPAGSEAIEDSVEVRFLDPGLGLSLQAPSESYVVVP